MLVRPQETLYDAQADATFCRFEGPDAPLTGYYHARMGVCWPGTVPTAGATFYSGFMALLAVNRESWATYVMGLQEFQTVATVATVDMRTQFQGIGPWLGEVRRAWNCATCYWVGDLIEHYKWAQEIERDPLTAPKPDFVAVPWSGPEQGVMQVLQFLNTRRMFLPPDPTTAGIRARLSVVSQHLERPSADVLAVAIALHGLTTAWPRRIE